jgi:hypothetical protein
MSVRKSGPRTEALEAGKGAVADKVMGRFSLVSKSPRFASFSPVRLEAKRAAFGALPPRGLRWFASSIVAVLLLLR